MLRQGPEVSMPSNNNTSEVKWRIFAQVAKTLMANETAGRRRHVNLYLKGNKPRKFVIKGGE